MRRHGLVGVVVAAAALAITLPVWPGHAHSAIRADSGLFDDTTVLVGFQPGTSGNEQSAIENANGAVEENVQGADTHVIHVASGQVR